MSIQHMNSRRDRDFVNVVSELSYWQERFRKGSFVADSFDKDCAPVIKLACDIYLRDPHGTDTSWVSALCSRIPSMPSRLNVDISKQVAQLCWSRLNETNYAEANSFLRLQ